MLCSLLCFPVHSYEIKNNGNKFYRRNFMQVADKKLIINELGPKICSDM